MTLDDIRVCDCMHAGIVSCSPDAPLSEVAQIMGAYRVHAVAVADLGHGRPWGTWRIVSDMDLMAAIATGNASTARQLAPSEADTISSDEKLEHAARAMHDHATAHLIVVDPAGGYPVGIISTLDVASAYATAGL